MAVGVAFVARFLIGLRNLRQAKYGVTNSVLELPSFALGGGHK